MVSSLNLASRHAKTSPHAEMKEAMRLLASATPRHGQADSSKVHAPSSSAADPHACPQCMVVYTISIDTMHAIRLKKEARGTLTYQQSSTGRASEVILVSPVQAVYKLSSEQALRAPA